MSPCRAAILVAVCLLSRANADEKGIASVDTYGLHHVDRKKVLEVAGLSEGDRPPRFVQWKAISGRLEKIPGVKRAAIVVVTAPTETATGGTIGRPIVYLGIQESDQPDVKFRVAPTGKVALPTLTPSFTVLRKLEMTKLSASANAASGPVCGLT